ncbi:MAG: DEAD/DEAH box helicase [Gammaproteobacteria bacterium]|nr:DEAD/DEAH box helicase [Gammaproteobacteria bacterium]
MSFNELGLSKPLLKAISDSGYTEPTSIQSAAIGPVLSGKDLMASAQTGTGKTAAFTLPLLEKLGQRDNTGNHPRVLVITPTRELAAQIEASANTYGKYTTLQSLAVFGGVKIGPQIKKLHQGIDILIATPGRLLDLSQQGAVNLKQVEVLVLDEADRMLDMGFIPDIRRIQKLLPDSKQTLMFSATYSPEIRKLAHDYLSNPVEINVTPKNAAAHTVEQVLHPVDKRRKSELLQHLVQLNNWSQALVFSKTKHGANKLTRDLAKTGVRAAAIHGNKSQAQRTKALEDFKRGKVEILVATDIASRGIDISELPMVINFDLPHVPEDYVHRIGRTGRAGTTGNAISLVCADESKQLRDIERVIKKPLERVEIEGFEPDHVLPLSSNRHERSGNNSGFSKNNSSRGNSSRGNSSRGNSSRGNSSRGNGSRDNGSRGNGSSGNGSSGNGSNGNSRNRSRRNRNASSRVRTNRQVTA